MKFLRLMLEVLLTIILLPFIVIVCTIWMFHCIRTAYSYKGSFMDGFRLWTRYIVTGLKMNKDFVINGFKN